MKTLVFCNNRIFCCQADLEQEKNKHSGKSLQQIIAPVLHMFLIKFAQSLVNLGSFNYVHSHDSLFDPLWYYISDNQCNNKHTRLKTLKLKLYPIEDSSGIHSFIILNSAHDYNYDLNDVDITLVGENYKPFRYKQEEKPRAWDIANLQNIKKILVSSSSASNCGLGGEHISNITKLRLQLNTSDYYINDWTLSQTVFDTLSTQINFDKLLYFEYVEDGFSKLQRLPQTIILLDQLFQTFPKYKNYGLLTKVALTSRKLRTGTIDKNATKSMCNILRTWYQNGLVDCKVSIACPDSIDNDGSFHKCVTSQQYFKKNNQLLSKQTKNTIIQRRMQHPMCSNDSPFVALYCDIGYWGDVVVINAMTDEAAKHFKIEDYDD